MTPKAFTTEARAAIDSKRGALFDAIVNAYIAANIRETDGLDANEEDYDDGGPTDPYEHVPELLKNLANPYVVHLVYAFYNTKFPTHVSVAGHRIRILQPKESTRDRASIIKSFNLVFGGKRGWIKLATRYRDLGYDRKRLELLAVRWLQGDWDNAEFLNECRRVPGFDQQLAAVTTSEDGQQPSTEDMLHLAGYAQLKAEYAREGGNPEDMDELARAFLNGDEACYERNRRQFEAKNRRGCLTTLFLMLAAVVVVADFVVRRS